MYETVGMVWTGPLACLSPFAVMSGRYIFILTSKIKFTIVLFDRALKGKTKQIRLHYSFFYQRWDP